LQINCRFLAAQASIIANPDAPQRISAILASSQSPAVSVAAVS